MQMLDGEIRQLHHKILFDIGTYFQLLWLHDTDSYDVEYSCDVGLIRYLRILAQNSTFRQHQKYIV